MRLSVLLATLVPALMIAGGAAAQQPRVTDPNFAIQTLYRGHGTISIDFGPGGRLYVTEKVGRILTFAPDGSGGFAPPTELADFRALIDHDAESGLLGLIVDPEFATNRHMFLFYTTTTDQKVVRIEVNASFDQMVAGSETILLQGLPRIGPYHKAGDLQFHPDDPEGLYLALGEDSRGAGSQDPSIYPGKILRFSKIDGLGFLDNPFSDGDPNSVQSRVWAVGFRNPFRFVIHPDAPVADVIYVSENGASTDRFSWVKKGANGTFDPDDWSGYLTPPDPNFRVLGTPTPFICGIAIASGGPFEDPDFPGSSVLYLSNPADANMRGAIHRYRLTGVDHDVLQPVARDNGQPFATGVPAMDMAIGPDGAMYGTRSNTGAALETFYAITRIKYIPGHAPVAQLALKPSSGQGEAPFSVSFSDASTDFDGFIASWLWELGDGETSTEANPVHVYQRPGVYTVTLSVTDDDGLMGTATTSITAVSSKVLTLRGRLKDGRRLDNAVFPEPTEIRIYANDATTLLAGPFAIRAGGIVELTIDLQPTSTGLVLTAGENTPGILPRYYGFTIPATSRTHLETIDLFLSSGAIRGQILDTRLEPASVDIGISRERVGMLYAFADGRDYLASSGIPATGIKHRTMSDALGYYYVPLVAADAVQGTIFFAGIVGDTGATTYFPASFQAALDANALALHDVTLGLQSGGASCDELAGAEVTGNVDYATQIQPIWNNNCAGCHDAGLDISGGLNLKTNSWANIVGVMSVEVPGKKLIEPGDPERSFLFEKINCASPQIGTRMQPTGDNLSAEAQALIELWIREGARPMLPQATDAGVPDGGASIAAPKPTPQEDPELDSLCTCTSGHSTNSTSPLLWLVALFFVQRSRFVRNTGLGLED